MKLTRSESIEIIKTYLDGQWVPTPKFLESLKKMVSEIERLERKNEGLLKTVRAYQAERGIYPND
ncbi:MULTISPECIES: hypothetical protein [Bacillus]|uniref:Uncharacterized protein n=1 Tax=Bacillus glycinifermentans TaxID=1664069 RepID=A0AAJ3Z037_9BACI|nr:MULTISPECIES: hypothetical protein [Bacillus]KKB72458.1 hypothetical protein TH62_16620 [Bacillus sp. TH008]MDU0070074.1 hypothetical protein [Bacillus sp. IG6]MED8017747.1 hypothetical protein [Bacillus glycinifermentans]QAT66406.1 hypothetical protein EQZ20_16870 [Bacillus glycinifermentans]WKB76132.1 hypothetical protein QYM22_17225 [Bacillus glycinifermentans]